jgi:hypothetical protein
MFDELLKKVSEALEKHHIPYMLSGSGALGIHAVSRMTRDIDIVIQLKQTDIDAFLSEFKGFYFNRTTIEDEIKKRGMFNLIDTQSGYKIDFIIVKDSEYGLEAFGRRQVRESNGINVWVISAEDLIIAKLIWIQDYQSDRQISDIKSVLLDPELDKAYLSHWIKKLQLKTYGLL